MKMIVFALLMVLMTSFLPSSAQQLAQTGREVKELVPEGWTVQEAWGDLFHNGRDHLVLLAVPNNPAGITTRDDGYEINSNKPVLAIYYMSEEGDLIRRFESDIVIPVLEDMNYSTDVELVVTEKGSLKITLITFFSAGSYISPGQSYTFRYQDDDFYLIGEDSQYHSRVTGDGESISTNYLTCKQSRTSYNVFEEPPQELKTRWKRIERKPLRQLGSFTLGE